MISKKNYFRTYVSQLTFLVDCLQKPLQELAFTPNAILSSASVSTIFSNSESILNINKQLLADLESRIVNWSNKTSRLGDIFKNIIPFLKLYTQYVNNYDIASKHHIECEHQKPEYVHFLEKAFASHPDLVTGLPNYLILPIQRIPRYELLLRELVKITDVNHPDFKDLSMAFSQIQAVAK